MLYFRDYRTLYANDRTFRLLYVRGHTNLSTYTLGLTGGLLAYYWQKNGKNFDEFKVTMECDLLLLSQKTLINCIFNEL